MKKNANLDLGSLFEVIDVSSEDGDQSSVIATIIDAFTSDVRSVAALEMLNGRYVKIDLLKNWIIQETNSEVRSYLYMAMSHLHNGDALEFLNKIELPNDVFERLHLIASLSIATRSRFFLLEIIKYFYHQDRQVSNLARNLSKNLLDTDDAISLQFLKQICRDAAWFKASERHF